MVKDPLQKSKGYRKQSYFQDLKKWYVTVLNLIANYELSTITILLKDPRHKENSYS